MKIRAEDTVLIIRGRDRGKQGKVVRTFAKSTRVQVEGVNVVKKHMKVVVPGLGSPRKAICWPL